MCIKFMWMCTDNFGYKKSLFIILLFISINLYFPSMSLFPLLLLDLSRWTTHLLAVCFFIFINKRQFRVSLTVSILTQASFLLHHLVCNYRVQGLVWPGVWLLLPCQHSFCLFLKRMQVMLVRRMLTRTRIPPARADPRGIGAAKNC